MMGFIGGSSGSAGIDNSDIVDCLTIKEIGGGLDMIMEFRGVMPGDCLGEGFGVILGDGFGVGFGDGRGVGRVEDCLEL